MGGRLRLESVATLVWNTQPLLGFAQGAEIEPPHDMIKLHSGSPQRMH